MGCWNETCAFSGMPIHVGDKVMWMMLTERRQYESNGTIRPGVYPEDFWAPRHLPVVGEYDDYGGVENVENDIFMEMIIDMLKIDMVEKEQTDRMKMISVPSPKIENLKFENIQGWLHEGYLFADSNAVDRMEAKKYLELQKQTDRLLKKHKSKIKKSDKKPEDAEYEIRERKFRASERARTRLPVAPVPVVKIMILKDVWDYLVNMPPSNERFGQFSFRNPSGFQTHVDKFIDTVMESAEKWRNGSDSLRSIIDLDAVSHLVMFSEEEKKQNQELVEIKEALYWLGHDSGPYTMSAGRQIEMMYKGALDKSISVENFKKLLIRAMELYVIKCHVHDLRITWAPTTGSGSQTSALDSHMRFAKFCSEYAYKKERKSLVESLESEKEFQAKQMAKEKKEYDYSEDIAELEEKIKLLDEDYFGIKTDSGKTTPAQKKNSAKTQKKKASSKK